MSQYAEFLNDLGDRMTEGMERLQEFQLEQLRTWQSGMGQFASVFPQLPENENLPSLESIVKANFGFAERMLESQRKFAMSLTEALAAPDESEESEEAADA